MQKGRVVNLNKIGRVIEITSKHKILIILTATFLIGLSIGIFTFGKFDFVNQNVSEYLSEFVNNRTKSGFLNIFVDSFFNSMIFVILSFCIGTSMFGSVIILPIILFRAFSYGSLISFLYIKYSMIGIAFNAVILLPFSCLFIVSFLISCAEALKFSFLLANQTFFTNEYKNISLCFKNYCLRHSIILFLVILSAMVDALISTNFISNFKIF